MSTEKDVQTTNLSKRSSSTSARTIFDDEKKTNDNDSTRQEVVAIDGKPNKAADLVDGADLDEAEYPTGMSFILIIMALFLCVFLTALDMVRLISRAVIRPLYWKVLVF